jgi:hypothetical protein
MTSYKDALGALTAAIGQLNQAYKAANTMEDKDKIFSVMELLQDEVNAVAAAGLAASDAAYSAQAASLKNAADQIAEFQSHVDQYVKYIGLAGQVAEALKKVVAIIA